MEWGNTLVRCDLGCAALSIRSAKSSCIVCSACTFGMGRHNTTVRCGVCCSEHSLCQIILHCLFGVQFWNRGDTLLRCELGCASLSTRSARSSCIVCSACIFGVGKDPTTVGCAAPALPNHLALFVPVQFWNGETQYHGASWGVLL